MKQLTRREFLKATAAGSLTVAASGLLGVNAFADDAIYKPGVYTASADGIGVVTVTMKFSECFAERILSSQSFDVDGISGASLTSAAVKRAAENCIAQAKGMAEPLVSPNSAAVGSALRYDENGVCTMSRAEYFEATKPQIGDITSVEDFDVVVIGAGNGGLVAAASAADLGGKVIVIEKSGGFTTWAGEIGAINSKVQKEKYGVEYSPEEVQEIANDICRYASYRVDQRLIELYCKNSGRTMDWVIDQMDKKDIEFMVETDMKDTIYKNVPHQHCAYKKGTFTEMGPNQLGSQIANPAWIELIQEKGGEIRFNTTAMQLVQDDSGRVNGVIVRNEDGSFSQINGSKGVMVATGGFSGNTEMMDVMGVVDHRYAANTMGCGGRVGDGIKMCVWAGAAIDDDMTGGIMLFDRGAVALDHHVGPDYIESLTDMWWPGSQPWLKVNTLGQRFCNEDGPYDFECHAIADQPGHFAYQVFDSNYWSDVNAFHTTICSRVVAWITVDAKTSDADRFVLRDLILLMYWDNENTPSVEVPLGDFFCCGFGQECQVYSAPIIVAPSRGLNSYFAMPFRKEARIELLSEHKNPIPAFFYQIDYCLYDELPEETEYFHAQWRREKITTLKQDYVIADGIQGKGRYVGTYIALQTLERYWWGEGEVKFYIDGDREYPTICGTGMEDYVGGSWSFAAPKEMLDEPMIETTYNSLYMGYPFYSNRDTAIRNPYHNDDCPPMRGLYRWHLPDPVFFDRDLKVTVQQIGDGLGPHGVAVLSVQIGVHGDGSRFGHRLDLHGLH